MKISAYKCSDGSIVETLEEWQAKELAGVMTGEGQSISQITEGLALRLVESRDKIIAILTGEQPKKPRAKRSDVGKARTPKPQAVAAAA